MFKNDNSVIKKAYKLRSLPVIMFNLGLFLCDWDSFILKWVVAKNYEGYQKSKLAIQNPKKMKNIICCKKNAPWHHIKILLCFNFNHNILKYL